MVKIDNEKQKRIKKVAQLFLIFSWLPQTAVLLYYGMVEIEPFFILKEWRLSVPDVSGGGSSLYFLSIDIKNEIWYILCRYIA